MKVINSILWAIPGAIYKVFFGLVFLLTLILLYPFFLFLLHKPERFPKAFKLKRIWAWIICTGSFIFVHIKNRKYLKQVKGPVIICANHASYLDIVVSYIVYPQYFIFMGKAELKSWPLFKIFFTKEMDIAVERSSVTKAARSLDKAKELLLSGQSIVLFPEGGIPNSGKPKMMRFKNGAFKLAMETQTPILPLSYLNNYRIFSDPEHLFMRSHPGIAKVVVHECIHPDQFEDLNSFKNHVYEVIDGPLKTK